MSALFKPQRTSIINNLKQKAIRHYRKDQNRTEHSSMLTEERMEMMAENIIATWRTPGIFKADAQKVCDELREIGEEFTPEEIVDAARDEETELHKCFEWDDKKAAHGYRLQQARILTSQLVFKREVKDDAPPPAPVRVFNKTDNNGGYKIPERTFKVQEEYEALLQRALAELHAFKVKYAALKELDFILELID